MLTQQFIRNLSVMADGEVDFSSVRVPPLLLKFRQLAI